MGRGLDGHAGHTQRWSHGDHGNRVHRQTSAQGARAVCTALMHHYNLRACFEALDGTKAPGVDGVTKWSPMEQGYTPQMSAGCYALLQA